MARAACPGKDRKRAVTHIGGQAHSGWMAINARRQVLNHIEGLVQWG